MEKFQMGLNLTTIVSNNLVNPQFLETGLTSLVTANYYYSLFQQTSRQIINYKSLTPA